MKQKHRKYCLPRHYVELGAYLQSKRLEASLTQKEVSDVLRYSSPQFISNAEVGIAVPPLKKLKVMIKMYGANADLIIELILAAERSRLEKGLK